MIPPADLLPAAGTPAAHPAPAALPPRPGPARLIDTVAEVRRQVVRDFRNRAEDYQRRARRAFGHGFAVTASVFAGQAAAFEILADDLERTG